MPADSVALLNPSADEGTGHNAGWPSGIVLLAGAAGTLGITLVTVAGIAVGPHGPTGSSIERGIVGLLPAGSAGRVFGTVTLALGLALALGAWILLGLFLRRGAPLRPLVRCMVAWVTPLAIGPPLFSRDVYSYAAQGLMVRQHLDPYHAGPAALGASRYLPAVSPLWLHSPSPYGPLFVRMSAGAVQLTGGSVLGTVIILRAFEILGLVLIAIALPKLAAAVGKDPARALWLGVLNPLVLFHFVGGAHNDGLMVGLLVAGLAAAAYHRPVLGVLLCVLATSIKAPAVVGVAFIVVDAVRQLPRERRLGSLLRFAGIGSGAFVVVTAITGMSWGWIGALGTLGKNRSLLTPTTFVAHWISNVIGHDELVLSATRGLGSICTVVAVAYLLWRSPRIGTARACGLALAVIVALGPIVLPWYALWGMIVLAATGRRIERGFGIFASALLLFVVEPSGSSMPDVVLMCAVVVLSTGVLAIAWRPVRSWIRNDLASTIDRYRRGDIVRLSTAVRSALPEFALARSGATQPPAA